jgi:hypothetical protein
MYKVDMDGVFWNCRKIIEIAKWKENPGQEIVAETRA